MRAGEGSFRGPLRAQNGQNGKNDQNHKSLLVFFSLTNQAGYMAIQIVFWWAVVVINGPYISINGCVVVRGAAAPKGPTIYA